MMKAALRCVRPHVELPLGVIPEMLSESSRYSSESSEKPGPKLLTSRKAWKSEDSSKTDKIVKKHHQKLALERRAITKFLQKNDFQRIDVNCQKRVKCGLMSTYPLHEAVRQENAELVSLLLKYGANPTTRDSCGYTAYHRAQRTKNQEVLQVFAKRCSADITPHGRSLLDRFPPPPGFEAFFAQLQEDPLVHKAARTFPIRSVLA
mmetsp:Transcript_119718/g.284418  ORF Transcript_119718/g.284418 Transcript_119718/m.284418 type:complete len:206 (-) Transcript_119718:257-874(-)|eukprot:CAMPEP_0181447644 /NCGR_PEP_ID=MMETSP1110-20121109/26728_1 /TAXON_ID=174948 /ORGANISM="Symbiodinium sp., Strain CCMP421" /LENGTH=205 /DNA_ID=CAMNT_0023571763 /DNA_START=70 /DNA_END=687 /DNA_ORIENTATION=+